MPSRETIYRKIRYVQEFRTVPAVLKRLLEVVETLRLSLKDVAAFVPKAQVLTARLLKIANTPYYGFIHRVASIRQAILLLGLNTANAVPLGLSVFRHVRGVDGLWARSVEVFVGPLKCLGLEQTFRRRGKRFPVCMFQVPGGKPLGLLRLPFPEEKLELLVLKVGCSASSDLFSSRSQRSVLSLSFRFTPMRGSVVICLHRYMCLLLENVKPANGWCHATYTL